MVLVRHKWKFTTLCASYEQVSDCEHRVTSLVYCKTEAPLRKPMITIFREMFNALGDERFNLTW